MNIFLLAFQASLCFLVRASRMSPISDVPIESPSVSFETMNLLPRIVGGEDAIPNEFPFMVHLFVDWPSPMGKSHCGASIINSRYILTAAHCVCTEKFGWAKPENVHLHIGTHGLTAPSAQKVIAEKIHYIFYDPTKQYYEHTSDIVIIRLAEKLRFGETVKPICLASGNNDYANATATVMGWGFIDAFNGNSLPHALPKNLQKIQIRILSNEECNQVIDHATPNKICIDANGDKKGICQGDSGGPLVVKENDKYVQVGIASYITTPCGIRTPSVYVRVTFFNRWIKEIVGSSSFDC